LTGLIRYLLDTNIVSDLARNPQGRIAECIKAVGAEQVAISIVVACEIRFVLDKIDHQISPNRLAANVRRILAELTVIPLEPPADEHSGDIRSSLQRAGTPIGPNDLLIAAHARGLGLTLVTDNVREFARVPGLTVENWLEVPG